MLSPQRQRRDAPAREARPGGRARVLDRFELERERERTDAGVVHDAVETTTGHDVAVEIASALETPAERARYVRDARMAQRFDGDHVLRVHEAGAMPDGTPVVVREPTVTSLAKEIATNGAVAPEQAVAWTLEVAEALAEAHALGMAHGAVAPESVFLVRGEDGRLRVKLAWATAAKAKRDAALASARKSEVLRDLDGLGRVLRALTSGVVSEEQEDLGNDGAKTLPNGIAHVVARATTRDGSGYEDLGELVRELARLAPAGHASARNVAFMLWHAGIGVPRDPESSDVWPTAARSDAAQGAGGGLGSAPPRMATIARTPMRSEVVPAARDVRDTRDDEGRGPYDGDPVQPVPWTRAEEEPRWGDEADAAVLATLATPGIRRRRRSMTAPLAILALVLAIAGVLAVWMLRDRPLPAIGDAPALAEDPFTPAPETESLADSVTMQSIWHFGSVLPPHGARAERERAAAVDATEAGDDGADPGPSAAPAGSEGRSRGTSTSTGEGSGAAPSPLGAPDSPAPFDLGAMDI